MHQHGGLALGLQAIEHADGAFDLAGQNGFGQFERGVARHVEHRVLHLFQAQNARRVQQRELLNFLVRREQIALHPIGKKLQGGGAFFARGHLLALGLQTLSDPRGQSGTLHGIDLDHHARAVQRSKPSGLLGRSVQPGQEHQGQGAVVVGRPFGDLLQRHRALFTRFARGYAHLDELLVGEQAHGAATGQHLAPIEVCAGHREDGALGVPLGSRLRSDAVGGFLDQQRLIAVQGVERLEAALQLSGQLGKADLHGRGIRRRAR